MNNDGAHQFVLHNDGNPLLQQNAPSEVISHLVQDDEPDIGAAYWPVKKTNQTIYTFLSTQERYSKLIRLINWEESYVAVLNATEANITFFAADNKALTPPRRRKPHHGSLSQAYEEYERLVRLRAKDDGDEDDDDEEKKKRLKKLVHAILKYHTLPTDFDRPALYKQATYDTALKAKDGSYDSQPRRIAVTNDPFGRLFVNFYSTVEWLSIDAENGFVYGINRPLFPPPSILDELFFIDDFSTLTSALQKVELDNALQWRVKWTPPSTESETEGDGPVVSLFAPNNWAFKRLPSRLRLYLFSPRGAKALKKLLQFHIVPDYILHSDWVHNATKDDELTLAKRSSLEEGDLDLFLHECSEDFTLDLFSRSNRRTRMASRRKMKKMLKKLKEAGASIEEQEKYASGVCRKFVDTWPPHHGPPDITVNITIPTLLEDHPLRFVVAKPKLEHVVDDDLTDPLVIAEMIGMDRTVVETHQPLHTVPPLARSFVFAAGVKTIAEGVARNGAVYVIGQVLHPFKPNSHLGDGGRDDNHDGIDHRWDDWEDWLPTWGDA
ncbi:hypothetical protein FRC16_002694 [Serendipita sp. 398]|nr:hypothetical protein FRC16_002694 [Serendipita sp. 398]